MTTTRAPLRLDHFHWLCAKPTTSPASSTATSRKATSSGAAIASPAIRSSDSSLGFDS